MATDYCTVAQVVSFLKITDNAGALIVADSTTDPTLTELEDQIKRSESEIDERTKHAWRVLTIANEPHDIINVYEYGRGLPIHLFHRNIRTLAAGQGDKLEIWDGQLYSDIISQVGDAFVQHEEMGIVYLKGFVFSIFRSNRLRVTYRYGGEQGDQSATPVVPRDIEDCCIKLTAIRLIESSFAMSNIQFGQDRGMRTAEVIDRWRRDIDDIIQRHAEWIHIEF